MTQRKREAPTPRSAAHGTPEGHGSDAGAIAGELAGSAGVEPPRSGPRTPSRADSARPGSSPPPSGDRVRPFAADLLQLIERRQSSRGPFDPHRRIPIEHLRQILTAGRWAPTAHNMQNFQIVVVDDRDVLEALSNVQTETSLAFVQETHAQLSFSEDELKQKRVGILASSFPPSWWTPGVSVRFDESHAHSILGAPIKSSAALMVIVYDPRTRAPASEGDVLGMMSLGCVMENMWLAAQALGIGFQVQSAFSSRAVEAEVKRILAIPEPLRIGFAARLGYPQGPARYVRVRRDVGEFAHDNGFGVPWRRA